MAASALDPGFGQGGVVLGLTEAGLASNNQGSALAVQTDGKIVEAETGAITSAGATKVFLEVLRYNADGSVDSTFGEGGRTNIPLGDSSSYLFDAPRNLVIEPNGGIVLAAQAENPGPNSSLSSSSIVVRLTAAGQLDPSFGTSGEVVLPDPNKSFRDFTNVAVQGDGKIVVAGVQQTPAASPGALPNDPQLLVVRLTVAGALDTSFNQTGELAVTVPGTSSFSSMSAGLTPTSLAIAPNGQIDLASNVQLSIPLYYSSNFSAYLSRINSDGTLDTSFGTQGNVSLSINQANSMVIQPDGKVVLAGAAISPVSGLGSTSFGALIRLLPSGSPDPTFQVTGVPPAPSGYFPFTVFNSVAIAADGGITAAGISEASARQQNLVERFLAAGTPDARFGIGGKVVFAVSSPTISVGAPVPLEQTINSLALTPSGRIVVGGGVGSNPSSGTGLDASQSVLAQLLPINPQATPNDYEGVGKSNIAAELAAFGVFAYRKSGGGDVLASFGPAGIGQAIPAPGDYDGDGKTDIAAYLPAHGVLVYRPSTGIRDVVVPFGIAGAGQSIPAPGDYDGDGKTDVAVYLPSLGILAYRPSSGGPDVLTQFGFKGAGQSIPAPGDYNGDGKTDVAVYLPSLGVLAYRPSGGGADVLTQFGLAGAGQSIPAPGDYDGDGKTDIAVYLPSLGVFAVRPSGGGADALSQFGLKGASQSIPAPGDYDGDGKTDIAAYLPSLGLFAYRPTNGGGDVIEAFGARGTGQTVPAASIASAQPATVSSAGLPGTSNAVNIPLTEDLPAIPPGPKKKHHA